MTYEVIKEAVAKQQSGDKKLATENKVLGKVMTFYVDDTIYGIEIENVVEIIEVPQITRVPHLPPFIKGIINVRSKVVPVVNIRSRFGKEEIPYNDRSSIIIVCFEDIQVGIIVDEIRDVIPVTERHIAKSPDLGVNHNKFIKYLLEMPDGIKLVLDVNKLVYENEAVVD